MQRTILNARGHSSTTGTYPKLQQNGSSVIFCDWVTLYIGRIARRPIEERTMTIELSKNDLHWLNEVREAADVMASLAGVPLNVKATLAKHQLIDWVGASAVTISSKGRERLEEV